jgi:hypothetical protein
MAPLTKPASASEIPNLGKIDSWADSRIRADVIHRLFETSDTISPLHERRA